MQPKNPLHLGALFIAAAALLWALSVFVRGLYFPAYLCGFIDCMILVIGLGIPRGYRTRARAGAIPLLLVHITVIVLFVFVTPVNLGEDPDTGFNLQPRSWTAPAMMTYVSIIMPMLLAVFLPLNVLVVSSDLLERILAVAGAAVVLLVVVLGLFGLGGAAPARFDYTENGYPIVARIMLCLGFLIIAAASALPVLKAARTPWSVPDPETAA